MILKLTPTAEFDSNYIDVLTIIINRKLTAKDLGSMIFAFPTPTYGFLSTLIPLFLKKEN